MLKQIGLKDKKKAYTLIELVIAIALELIVLGVSFQIILTAYKSYKIYNEKSIINDSFDDAQLNIDRLLKNEMIENIEIIDNEIIIYYKEKHSESSVYKKLIRLDSLNNKIIIETFNNNLRIGVNVVLRNVSEFTIINKENIYYLIITNLNGEKRIQCL
ncbi:prepilin-type cleavage/methylation domain-containing protein [Caproiciproducens sp. MSJ-32]|uniref:prepilin-type cleavage/methylation domain-containing protein n=1 Tax=Caproiciproducens sp. MSJ-32 TaxID=2841527 RepID=UPI002570589B|nr:prepilin-type cleavage/methylation domain-containing protein [Caproiciproducens sp. MSJ-32]